jgi:acetyl-CoA carboxylase carboxyltransferase component
MQFGGVIYSDSADKATRFIAVQSEKNPLVLFRMLPVLWWDLNQKAEYKDGAKMVNAVSNSVVPYSLLLWEILWCWKLCDVWKTYDQS